MATWIPCSVAIWASASGFQWSDQVRKLSDPGSAAAAGDCANAVAFLCSDYARVITGAGLDVNGGEFMP